MTITDSFPCVNFYGEKSPIKIASITTISSDDSDWWNSMHRRTILTILYWPFPITPIPSNLLTRIRNSIRNRIDKLFNKVKIYGTVKIVTLNSDCDHPNYLSICVESKNLSLDPNDVHKTIKDWFYEYSNVAREVLKSVNCNSNWTIK